MWINSAHTNKIDTKINSALHTISGTLKGTPLEWYFLCNIAPPELLRRKCYKNLIERSIINERFLLFVQHLRTTYHSSP